MTDHRFGPGRPCPCGSGLTSRWQHDARGIELCRTCPDCHERKMARYRPEVLENPGYDAPDLGDDEPLEGDVDA